jgi:hypothetical protein
VDPAAAARGKPLPGPVKVALWYVIDLPPIEYRSSAFYPDGQYNRGVWVPHRTSGYWFCTEGGKPSPRNLICYVIFELVLDNAAAARAAADHRLPVRLKGEPCANHGLTGNCK